MGIKILMDRRFFLFIKDLLKEFIFDLQIKNYSDRTIETYNYNTTDFIQYLIAEEYVTHQAVERR